VEQAPAIKALAIVVPAWKPQFLHLALNSIAMQTNKNFQCYIFDDAAPEEIKSVSNGFPDFRYTRFCENMGGHDLVGHWHRCLASVNEEWVCFFSDDDIMEPNCVEEFYKTLNLYPSAALFRFARSVIDAKGQIIRIAQPIKNQTGLEFLKSHLRGASSCLQDHIFNRKKLETNGGFVNFPLAWSSDTATFCLLGKEHEIIAIPSAIVQIRMSGTNISTINTLEFLRKKIYAQKLFYLWSIQNLKLSLSHKLAFLRMFTRYASNHSLPFFQMLFQTPRILILFLAALSIPIYRISLACKTNS
jgi:hypothetical protein